jgi:hypothetical protein
MVSFLQLGGISHKIFFASFDNKLEMDNKFSGI